MAWDLSSDLMRATVQVEQALPDGRHIIGTGFLINDPTPDGRPRTVLVTANHVLNRMPGAEAHIGYRVQDKDGGWRFDPQPITIRAGGAELWTHHSSRDVAAITVKAPPEFAKAAIPVGWLAESDTFSKYNIGPGDEMMVLGYPEGLSANGAGFPILRSGRVASPVEAVTTSPTFLLDFRVFPGNSGGPVFIAEAARRRPGADAAQEVQFVAGMLTQQVELNNEPLEIGIVTDAQFIRDTLAELDPAAAPAAPAALPTTVVQTPQPPPIGVARDSAVVRAMVGRAVSD
jgi:V8-like Glu-specific endopeptidase